MCLDVPQLVPMPIGSLLELPKEGLDFEALERDLVIQAVRRSGGNLSAAGRLLAMTRYQIRYRLEKHDLWSIQREVSRRQNQNPTPKPRN